MGGCKNLSPEFLFYEVVVVAFVQQLTDKELFAMGRSTTMVKEKRTQITVRERKKERKKDAPQKFLTEKKEDDRFSVCNS